MNTAMRDVARQFPDALDYPSFGQYITQSCVQQLGAQGAWLGWVDSNPQVQLLSYSQKEDLKIQLLPIIAPASEHIYQLFQNKTPLVIPPNDSAQLSLAYFPLIAQDSVIAILGIAVDTETFFSPEVINFFETYSLLAASKIQGANLHAESRRQVSHIQALRAIDRAILSNLGLTPTTAIILQEVAKYLQADAISLLMLEPKTQTLHLVNALGFRPDTVQNVHLKIGESFAGQVALQQRTIHIENLNTPPGRFAYAKTFSQAGFSTYVGTPLIARSEVKGVLEIFQRQPFEPGRPWLTLLETFANQVAIAIDNAQLVKFLQDSHSELDIAYNATIEGLSRALELRDRETEGHTRRVTEITVQLARKMGVSAADIVPIRQGALLHDIGKMGIPDAILLKTGPLSEKEWAIMKLHPIYAYELISKVEHLKQAVDIPLYHHEKWDGSGYPYGLSGAQIPFAARLFAFADVYDALTSNRPYRLAWSKRRTLFYIQSQAGTHFDPSIAPVFEKLIADETLPLAQPEPRSPFVHFSFHE